MEFEGIQCAEDDVRCVRCAVLLYLSPDTVGIGTCYRSYRAWLIVYQVHVPADGLRIALATYPRFAPRYPICAATDWPRPIISC
jgi:hypothetical protein